MRGRIRIRAPEDFPGRWTAISDIVPGEPYVYLSGDIAVEVRWLPEVEDFATSFDPEDTCLKCDHEYKKHATGCPPPFQPLPGRGRVTIQKPPPETANDTEGAES
jgi:hypothetical protein